jgi:hypothetical protein
MSLLRNGMSECLGLPLTGRRVHDVDRFEQLLQFRLSAPLLLHIEHPPLFADRFDGAARA